MVEETQARKQLLSVDTRVHFVEAQLVYGVVCVSGAQHMIRLRACSFSHSSSL